VPTGSTTLPVLAAEVAPSAGAPVGMLATAGALVVSGVGLLAWRYRRMGN
jgi:hypothetical protein